MLVKWDHRRDKAYLILKLTLICAQVIQVISGTPPPTEIMKSADLLVCEIEMREYNPE